MISHSPIRTILVLCEANHCRAPIAEAFLRSALGPGFQVGSAGLRALVDEPPDPEGVRLTLTHGLDITAHRGRQFTPDMALEADLILVMDVRQKEWCCSLAPSAWGRTFLLTHWLSFPQEIEDPFLRGPEVYQRVIGEIRDSVSAWVPHLQPVQRLA